MAKIRVLIVDDSALMRNILSTLLSQDRSIEIVGTASDPVIAKDKIKKLSPDVLTLDVEMPRMDGLTFLERLMVAHPMPVLMVSSLTEQGCETTLRALELGAVDFYTKPKVDLREVIVQESEVLIAKVKAVAKAKVRRRDAGEAAKVLTKRPLASAAMIKTTDTIVAVGASTGGTEAIREMLEVLPPDMSPIVVTQHMPEKFTRTFATRLDKLCHITVKEAEHGDSLIRGQALIAPGGYHMRLVRDGARYHVALDQQPPVNHHRPSVDVMFESAAKNAGANCIGVILTGMGSDGALGMRAMKLAGAYTIAQDEASCVVYGMPKEALAVGGVDKVLPLSSIASHVLSRVVRAGRGEAA